MDIYSFMFFYYDEAAGVPQIGAIIAMPDKTDNSALVGIMRNSDIEGNEDFLEQTMTNPAKWAFAGGIPQSLLN